MLKKAVDAPPSDEEIVEEDVASDSDEDDGIGFKKAETEKPGRKRQRTKGPEDPTPASGAPSGPNPNKVERAAAKASGKRKAMGPDLAEMLSIAQTSVSALEGFSPLAFWQGSLKIKDIDKRLSLAFSTQAQMEDLAENSPDAQNWSEKIGAAGQRVSDWLDVVTPLKNQDSGIDYMRKMDADDIKKFLKFLPPDAIHCILCDIGKKLWEDQGMRKKMRWYIIPLINYSKLGI